MAYENTEVAVERSQGEIRKLLYKYEAANFAFTETSHEGQRWAAIDFVLHEQRVRMRVPLKPADERAIRLKAQRARTKTFADIEREVVEQEAKRIWRVMFHTLKARLVSVEEGVETFEEAFLSHLVDPITGLTMWEAVKSAVEAGALKAGGPGLMQSPLLELAAPVDDGEVVDAEVVE
jgi:hypothetical protein